MTATAVFSEAQLEEAVLEILTEMGYETAFGPEISVDGTYPERQDYQDVLLRNRLWDALCEINPDLPQEALEEAFRKVLIFNSPSLIENNRHFHTMLTEGIDVTFQKNGDSK